MTEIEGTTPGAASAEAIDAAEVVTKTDKIRFSNKMRWEGLWKQRCPDFRRWLGGIGRFGGNPVDAMVLTEEHTVCGPVFKASLFTERNEYTITARPSGQRSGNYDCRREGYLGAVVSARRPRAGEDSTRGRDLADGVYHVGVWHAILMDIVAFELVRLGK